MNDDTTAYYTENAQAFFADTVAVAMAPLYARFLPHIPPGGHILDAGCGSGRDTLAFSGTRLSRHRLRRLADPGRPGRAPYGPAGPGAAPPGPGVVPGLRRHLGLRQPAACPRRRACRRPWAASPRRCGRVASSTPPSSTVAASAITRAGASPTSTRPVSAALLGQVPGLTELETWITGTCAPAATPSAGSTPCCAA